MAMVKVGSVSTTGVKPGRIPRAVASPALTHEAENRPQANPAAVVEQASAPVAGKEPDPTILTGPQLSPLPVPLATPTATPDVRAMSKPKTESTPETVPVTQRGVELLAVMEPGLEAGARVQPQLETVPGFNLGFVGKSDTVTVSREGQGSFVGGTCWALGLPYIHTFDGYSFPVLKGCTYTLSHCPEPMARGLPAFHLWATCSGARQSMTAVTLHVFGITITAVKHEVGFIWVRLQRPRGLPLLLSSSSASP